MYYSVTFINSSGVQKNTWSDWHLIPTSPPMIEPPDPYTNYVDIPGRTTGPIDLSEALTGGPSFNNSEGDWEFVQLEGYQTRMELYSELKTFLHNKQMKIVLEEDPTHYYYGRVSVSMPRTGKGNNSFGIAYNVRPVRYLLSNNTIDGM